MFEMIENRIRGGISSVMGKRHVKANNKYVNPAADEYYISDEYEKSEIMKNLNDLSKYFIKNYLLYLDANNLNEQALVLAHL